MAVTAASLNCPNSDDGLSYSTHVFPSSLTILFGGSNQLCTPQFLSALTTTEEAIEAAEVFFQYYRENANYLERTYDFVERVGIEKVRKETAYAPDAQRKKLLSRLRKSKALSSDAWLERENPVNPTQFVQIQPLENTNRMMETAQTV